MYMQVVLFDHQPRPDECQQVVLRDRLSGSLHEHDQQIERLRAERHRLSVREQPPFRRLQLETAETVKFTTPVSRSYVVVQSWLPV